MNILINLHSGDIACSYRSSSVWSMSSIGIISPIFIYTLLAWAGDCGLAEVRYVLVRDEFADGASSAPPLRGAANRSGVDISSKVWLYTFLEYTTRWLWGSILWPNPVTWPNIEEPSRMGKLNWGLKEKGVSIDRPDCRLAARAACSVAPPWDWFIIALCF